MADIAKTEDTDVMSLQIVLDVVVKQIENSGCNICASWYGEYGCPQAIIGGVKFTVEEKKT